jgi:hypothetical protein
VSLNDVPREREWRYVKGDDLQRTFRIQNPIDGVTEAWDLTDVTIAGAVRAARGTGSSLGSFTVSKADQTVDKGIYTLTLADTLTDDGLPDICYADIRFTDGTLSRTLQRFKLIASESSNYA